MVVCDVDEARARDLAARLPGHIRRSIGRAPAEVLAAVPDAVVIASATPSHAQLLLSAIEVKVPAFCEKPIALGVPETLDE